MSYVVSGDLSHHQQGAGQQDSGGPQKAGVHHRPVSSGPLWPESGSGSSSQDSQPIPPGGESQPDFVLQISGKIITPIRHKIGETSWRDNTDKVGSDG